MSPDGFEKSVKRLTEHQQWSINFQVPQMFVSLNSYRNYKFSILSVKKLTSSDKEIRNGAFFVFLHC